MGALKAKLAEVSESLSGGMIVVVDCGAINRVFALVEGDDPDQLAYKVLSCAQHAPWADTVPPPSNWLQRINYRLH